MDERNGKLSEANSPPTRDLTRTTLAVLLIGILIVGNFWILRPFLPSLLWAVMIVVATWPLMLGVQARLWGRRGLAVAVMTLALLLVFIVPFSLAVGTIVTNTDQIADWAKSLKSLALTAPPDWVGRIPLAGPKFSAAWQEIASAGQEGLLARLTPYAGKLVQWFAAQAGSVGMMVVQFLLTVGIAAILYSKGETIAEGLLRFVRRLAGPQGEEAAILAGKAVRGVALGVVVTALVQSTLGGIGLAVAGVPAPALLSAIMFMFCVAQIGAGVVLIPAVIWLYWSGHNVWGTVLLVVTILVLSLDNFLRPMLIKKGADLPLFLIFAGVIGGLIAFGIIGIFIGPVVLAVTFKLLGAWSEGDMGQSVTGNTRKV
jgi:predicted PurR-regulated permease PerM